MSRDVERKSFVVHIDLLDTLDELTDPQAGQLLRAVRAYHRGEEYEIEDVVVRVAFAPLRNCFSRDTEKYIKTIERNKVNGAKGGRPKNPNNQSGFSQNPNEPKKADSDNDSVNDNKSDITPKASCKQDTQDAEHLLRQTIDFDKLVERFNAITRGKFGIIRTPLSVSRKKMVRARVAEYGKESFIRVIEMATQSSFLSGQNSKEFTATFDWIIKPSNFEKILSGNYDNKKNVYNGNDSKFNRNDPTGSASSTGYETVL